LRCPLDMRLDALQAPSGCFGEEASSLPLTGIETRFFGRSASVLVIILIELQHLRFLIQNIYLLIWRCGPTRVMDSSFTWFPDHTKLRATVGRTPLDEWSAHRRDLYLTTHNTHNRQTSVLPVGLKPTISAGDQPQTYVLDRSATGTGNTKYLILWIKTDTSNMDISVLSCNLSVFLSPLVLFSFSSLIGFPPCSLYPIVLNLIFPFGICGSLIGVLKPFQKHFCRFSENSGTISLAQSPHNFSCPHCPKPSQFLLPTALTISLAQSRHNFSCPQP
jgi:hypothetical protein